MNRAVPAAALLLLALCSCRERSTATQASEVAAGSRHACARLIDGAVRCWGDDRLGQRGQGARLSDGAWGLLQRKPLVARDPAPDRGRQVVGLDAVEEIAAGANHTCARKANGAVWCWGDNAACQLGIPSGEPLGSLPFIAHPVRTPGLFGVVQLAAGQRHTCARRSDATVWCWGADAEGQLGHSGCAAAPVPGLAGVLELRAAGNTSCALIHDGTVLCWGDSPSGQDGAQGARGKPELVQGLKDVRRIAVAPTHACALTHGEQVWCWGSAAGGPMGEAAIIPADQRPQAVAVPRLARSTQLAVGLQASCGKQSDGRWVCVGAGQPGAWELPILQASRQVSFASTPPSEAARPQRPSGCAVMTNGACMCWGEVAPSAADALASDTPVQVQW